MMAATLNRDRDTASGVTDAPHLPAAARNVRGPGRASTRQRPLCEVRMGSLNVGTMEGKALEVVEMMKRRKMEVNQRWWTEEVAKVVGEKRQAWKMIEGIRDRGEQPSTGLKHLYGQKKKAARRAVDRARRSLEEELYRKLDQDGGKKMIFKMAWDRTEEGRDVKRGAVIKHNNGRLITESKEVLRIWAANFKELLNRKGAASCLELPSSVRREVEVEEIRQEEVETAMHKMKKGKATGADEVWLEMLEMAGDVGVKWTGRLLNVCMQEGRIPKEWRMGLIVPIWKRKGDVHDPGKYRGITLLSQVLKLLERVLDARIRRRVEGDFGEEQQGFRKGRGTADRMYALRQMVEKRLGFVDLEKAFDTVPREMVMATLRWMGVPEAEVRMVEGTYEKTTARVVVGEGASEEFEVKIGLRQGSVLSPLLFIAVLDPISRKMVVKDAMKKLLYADDLALVSNGKQELQETLEEWNGLFTRHGLKINVEKTEVLHIGHQREELDIELEGKKLTQADSFVYLRRGSVRRREDGERGTSKSTGWSVRVESS